MLLVYRGCLKKGRPEAKNKSGVGCRRMKPTVRYGQLCAASKNIRSFRLIRQLRVNISPLIQLLVLASRCQ